VVLALAYAAAAQMVRLAAAVAPAREGKTWRTLRARRGIRARYAAWGTTGRDRTRPLLWMHAPSVGEGLQARPILAAMRAAHPELQLAYTHFSPSAERFARSLGADFTDYLPFDTGTDARTALDALRPAALVFSKLDVWPTLTREASRRGVGLGLVSATLSAQSARGSRLGVMLLRSAYARLDAVGAIDAEDAERLVRLGVRAAVIQVTGDTRYDQVWARAQGVNREAPPIAPLHAPRPTMVAGSTWPADERVLLAAWLRVRRELPDARLIIAPHEPVESHLAPIEQWAANGGIRVARLGTDDAARADVVLVERVGVLGDLYALADVAYVGGGFHAAGLHSVLEPAAFGAPVLFGPRFERSRDARLLIAEDGGRAVADAGELADRITAWLKDDGERRGVGERARGVVRGGIGAAERSVRLVEGLLRG
jgi:3-deoxy-D-manno-octulosonic-acid transferase